MHPSLPNATAPRGDTALMDASWLEGLSLVPQAAPPALLNRRNLQDALERCLLRFTRNDLDKILYEELALPLPQDAAEPLQAYSKRELVRAFTCHLQLPALVAVAQRVVAVVEPDAALQDFIDRFHASGSGVSGAVKNLIFAANGPKPELVLKDAVSNTIEIVRNAEYCLVYDRPLGPEGLTMLALTRWWRQRPGTAFEGEPDVAVARHLHARLRQSLAGNRVETQLFDAYASRYRGSLEVPALIPQVYLHYDPYTRRHRTATGSVLERQRMDFLMLFSQRRRVVIEIDGVQHYADEQQRASPSRYAGMVAEDRTLTLAGYEVYRFGGKELDGSETSKRMLNEFFDDLARRSASPA